MTREEVKKLAEIIKKEFDIHDPSTIEDMLEGDPDEAVKEIIPKSRISRIESVSINRNNSYGGYCLVIEAYASDEPTIEERLMSAIKEAGLLEEEPCLEEDGDDEEQYYGDNEDDPDWDVDDEMVETPKEDEGFADTAEHYQHGDKQPIEVMQETMTKDQFQGFLEGNVRKYLDRYKHKGVPVRDTGKLAQYALWLHKAVNGEKIDPNE